MVLIIDDDKIVCRLMTAVLQREGMPTEIAGTGVEAIGKLRETDYRAVLLDVLLPDGDGLEVLRFIKRERPALMRRVVIVSAVSDRMLRSLSERDLVWGSVQKPFDVQNLVDVVRQCSEQTA